MWIIYLTIEILTLVIFIIMKIFGVEGMVVDIIKILPIGFNLIFTLEKKGMLKNALIFTLIVDCFVLIQYLFGFSKWVEGIIEIVEWTFYLTSQIMLVSILYFKNKTIVKESKQ